MPIKAPEVVCGAYPGNTALTLRCPAGKVILFGVHGRPFLTNLSCPPTSTNPDWGSGNLHDWPMGDDAQASCGDVQTLVLGCTGRSSCTFDGMPCAGGGTVLAEIVCM